VATGFCWTGEYIVARSDEDAGNGRNKNDGVYQCTVVMIYL
jgi:hypothetical protein